MEMYVKYIESYIPHEHNYVIPNIGIRKPI